MTKRKQRPTVDRAERVKPTPESYQHIRPWPLMLLLHQGPDAGGIDADEFEACIEIVETFKALTAPQQLHGTSPAAELRGVFNSEHTMSDHRAMMIRVWFEWSRQIGPAATHLVEQIEDAAPIRAAILLRSAARRWLRIKRDMLQSLDKQPVTGLTSGAAGELRGGRGHALPLPSPPPPASQGPSAASAARAPAQSAHRSIAAKRS